MGSLVLPVRELFSQPQLVLDQWMPLDGALSESEILLRAELKARDHTRTQGMITIVYILSDQLEMCC